MGAALDAAQEKLPQMVVVAMKKDAWKDKEDQQQKLSKSTIAASCTTILMVGCAATAT